MIFYRHWSALYAVRYFVGTRDSRENNALGLVNLCSMLGLPTVYAIPCDSSACVSQDEGSEEDDVGSLPDDMESLPGDEDGLEGVHTSSLEASSYLNVCSAP